MKQMFTIRGLRHLTTSRIMDPFQGRFDRFKGVTVASSTQPTLDESSFAEKLRISLEEWHKNEIRAVWFNVDLKRCYHWIGALSKEGFDVHHANPPDEVSMIKWISSSESNQIPTFAHHMIGVGGFVVNDKDEVLVVTERFRHRPHLKLPGGRNPLSTLGNCDDVYFVLQVTSIRMRDLEKQPLERFLRKPVLRPSSKVC